MYKRNGIYYFSKRINGKPYKISLQSDNLEYCKQIRDKIILILNKKELNRKVRRLINKKDIELLVDKTTNDNKIKLESNEIINYLLSFYNFDNKDMIELNNLITIDKEKIVNNMLEVEDFTKRRYLRNIKKEYLNDNEFEANINKFSEYIFNKYDNDINEEDIYNINKIQYYKENVSIIDIVKAFRFVNNLEFDITSLVFERLSHKKEINVVNNELESIKNTNFDNQFNSLEERLLERLNVNNNVVVKEVETTNNINIYNDIDKLYEDYIEHRKNFDKISHSSIKSYNASMKYLKYFINEDTNFNFKFFKDLQKNFQLIPKNFFKYKKYYELDFEELLELKEKENYETLDNKTINNHMNSYRLFFGFLKYEEVVENNLLSDIKPLNEAKGTSKEEYTNEELEKIFNSNLEKDYVNMCKISLYTGLRIEELMSIKKENIGDGILKIDLEDTSSKKHQRLIPIHKNLISVIDYQMKNKGDFLFFEGNVANEVKNVGKRINRRLKSLVNLKEKSFHSFRKNFSQEIELNTNSEEKIKKYLMGHSQSKDITHMIYNRGKVNVDKLKDCIEQITFEF